MMRKDFLIGLVVVGFSACTQQQPTSETATSTVPVPAVVQSMPLARPRPIDYTLEHRFKESPADTLIKIGSRHYRLLLRAETDSTRPVDYTSEGFVGNAFAAPDDSAFVKKHIRGYWGQYVFTLRDSTGEKTIFEQRVNKTAFYKAAPQEIVVVTPTDRPMYLGYSAGLKTLTFVVALYPGPGDFGYEATLLLDATTGKVRHLGPAHSAIIASMDCNPQLSASGRAILTCSELIRRGYSPLNLVKAHAQLVAARFLTDTTFLTVYEYGDYHIKRDADSVETEELVVPPALRHAPNAFVRGISGRVLCAFRASAANEFKYDLTRIFMPATRTYYFLDDKGVYYIRQARPDSVVRIPFQHLPRFHPPKLTREEVDTVRYLGEANVQCVLYIDTINPRRIRYQRLKN